jgi:hypothetical protein
MRVLTYADVCSVACVRSGCQQALSEFQQAFRAAGPRESVYAGAASTKAPTLATTLGVQSGRGGANSVGGADLFKYTALGAQRQTHDQLLHFLLLCDYMVLHAINVCVLESTRRVCRRFASPHSTRARAAHPAGGRPSALAAESDAGGGEGGRDKGGGNEICVGQERVCSPIVRVNLTLDLRRRELHSQDSSLDSEDPLLAAGGESDGEAEEVEAAAETAGEEEVGGGSVGGREGTTHRRKTSGKSSGKSSGKLSASEAAACLLLTPAEHELAAEINGIVSSFLATAGCRFYRCTTSFSIGLTTCGV